MRGESVEDWQNNYGTIWEDMWLYVGDPETILFPDKLIEWPENSSSDLSATITGEANKVDKIQFSYKTEYVKVTAKLYELFWDEDEDEYEDYWSLLHHDYQLNFFFNVIGG